MFFVSPKKKKEKERNNDRIKRVKREKQRGGGGGTARAHSTEIPFSRGVYSISWRDFLERFRLGDQGFSFHSRLARSSWLLCLSASLWGSSKVRREGIWSLCVCVRVCGADPWSIIRLPPWVGLCLFLFRISGRRAVIPASLACSLAVARREAARPAAGSRFCLCHRGRVVREA